MSEKTPSQVDHRQLLRIHQANYAVFQAKTEKEINQAILKVFQACPYANLFYVVNEVGLECAITHNSATKKALRDAPSQIEMTPADVVQFFAREASITSIAEANLPETLRAFWQTRPGTSRNYSGDARCCGARSFADAGPSG